MTKGLAIFDLDGTLFDTESAFIPAMKKFFIEFNTPYPGRDELMALVGEPGSVVKQWLESFNIPQPYEYLRKRMITLECESILEVGELFEGVPELLQWLNANNYIAAICTNAHNDYLAAVLQRTGIKNQFRYIYNPQHAGANTKPTMTASIIKEAGVSTGCFVGDRHHDFEAGKVNGLVTIGCNYGYGKQELLQADFRIDKPLQLIDLLQKP